MKRFTPATHFDYLALFFSLLLQIGNLAFFLPPSVHASSSSDPAPIRKILEKATPAVVSLLSVRSTRNASVTHSTRSGNPRPPGGHDLPSSLAPDSPTPLVGLGSGVLIRADGIVLTNHHVVEQADRITVAIDEKHRFPAKLLGADPKTDIALLQILAPPKHALPTPFPTLDLSSKAQGFVGDSVFAIGSPFGLQRSVTAGIISARGRTQMGMLDIEDFLQTDAAINPGNSGGPLLNTDGEVIGINTAIFSQTGGFIGIGFAIPSRIAREVSQEILTRGYVSRGWLGVSAQDLTEGLARYFKHPQPEQHAGALVSQVLSYGPAGETGLQPGDIITRMDGVTIDSAPQLHGLVGKTRPGKTIDLRILHRGRTQDLSVTLREQPVAFRTQTNSSSAQAGQKGILEKKWLSAEESLGFKLGEIPEELALFFKLPKGLGAFVEWIDPNSTAFDAGLAPGDIVLSVNQGRTRTATEARKSLSQAPRENIVLLIRRGLEEELFISLMASSPPQGK